MISTSVTLMTIVDLIIFVACGYAVWVLLNYRRSVSRRGNFQFHWVIIGLVVTALFYLGDLITMNVFPLFMPMDRAMNMMNVLHTEFRWPVSLIATGAIVYGFSRNVPRAAELIESLHESEGRFRDVVDSTGDWVWEMDENLRFTYVSPRLFEINSVAPEDVIGKTRREFSGVETPDENWRKHFEDLEAHRPFQGFSYAFAVDGRSMHFQINGKPVYDADGNFRGYIGTGTDRTAEVEAQRALEESESQFRNLIEGSIQGVFVHDDWNTLFANQALADMLGYDSPEEILALKRVEPLIAPDDRERLTRYRRAREKGERVPEVYEARGLRKDGQELWMEFRVRIVDWHGTSAMQIVVIDITDRKKAADSLRAQKEQLDEILRNVPRAIITIDEKGLINSFNPAAETTFGYAAKEAIGQNVEFLMPEAEAKTHHESLDRYLKTGESKFLNQGPRRVMGVHKQGHQFPMDLAIGETGGGKTDKLFIGVARDITKDLIAEEKLAHLAHHDALTGLANRLRLRERLEEELARVRRGGAFALLYLDLDDFKGVNDTLGHSSGDELLQVIAKKLRGCVRETDLVVRLGGDEFAVLQIAQQPSESMKLAERISNAFDTPFQLKHGEVVTNVSIGIASAPKDSTDPDELLKFADLALYQAKKTNRGGYCFFEQELEENTRERHALGSRLRSGLAGDELVLHYQPVIGLVNNEVTGFEALVRWQRDDQELVPPAIFIPIAEEMGLIGEIGEWVLQQACCEAASWPEEVRVSVNVSSVQFKQGDLLQVVKNALNSSGLSPGRLELEFTESVLLQNDGSTMTTLHQLKMLGVRIALDDFGTGYSSLSYLTSFPFDKIKIDPSFVHDLAGGDKDIGIVQAVVSIANKLGVETTAEGVETLQQLEIVRQEGCTEAQGYHFSPARPASEIKTMFEQWGRGSS
ncbi:Cyclic di-GMP phosphodiesterase Gmr [Roseibium album]|nr:Cyclic di-GMP phosphodiesterase Gmr [Roseibium album]